MLVVALVLVAAGCGGGSEEAGEDTDTTVVTETTTGGTTTDLDTSALEGFASEDCLELIGIGAALAQAFSSAGAGGDVGDTSELLDRLVNDAPEEIRADVQTLADAYSQYAQAVEELDLQAGEVPSAADLAQIQSAISSLDQPELQAASERLSAWAQASCPGG
jgi:hypothetical protein